MAFPPFDPSVLSLSTIKNPGTGFPVGSPGVGIFIWSVVFSRCKSCKPKKQSCGDTAFVENGLLSGIVIRCCRSGSLLIVLWFRCSGSGICQRLPDGCPGILPTAIFRNGLEVCLPTIQNPTKKAPCLPMGKTERLFIVLFACSLRADYFALFLRV